MKAKLKVVNEIFSWVLLIVVTFMLICSLYTVYEAKKTGEPAFLFGYRPVLVLTGSMEPYMMTNSIALTKEVTSLDELAVGDVVTFHVNTEDGNQLLITHRIVGMDGEYIQTKGDNNNVADGLNLTIDNMEAKVTVVFNQTAWIAAKWQTTGGKVMLICFAVAIIMLYAIVKFWLGSFRNKKETFNQEVSSMEQTFDNQVGESVMDAAPRDLSKKNLP